MDFFLMMKVERLQTAIYYHSIKASLFSFPFDRIQTERVSIIPTIVITPLGKIKANKPVFTRNRVVCY